MWGSPPGRVRHAADLHATYEPGRKILQSQTYAVQRMVESGDEIAIELRADRNSIRSGAEFAGRRREEGFRRHVSHLSRR